MFKEIKTFIKENDRDNNVFILEVFSNVDNVLCLHDINEEKESVYLDVGKTSEMDLAEDFRSLKHAEYSINYFEL